MEALGEVFLEVVAFSTGLLVLALIVLAIYMRATGHDPYTSGHMPRPRSMFMLLFTLFSSLMLFTSFVNPFVPKGLVLLRVVLLLLAVLFMAIAVFFFVKFVRYKISMMSD